MQEGNTVEIDEFVLLNYEEKENMRALLNAIEWMWNLQNNNELFSVPYNPKAHICMISGQEINRKHFDAKYTEYCYRAMLYGYVRGYSKSEWKHKNGKEEKE